LRELLRAILKTPLFALHSS